MISMMPSHFDSWALVIKVMKKMFGELREWIRMRLCPDTRFKNHGSFSHDDRDSGINDFKTHYAAIGLAAWIIHRGGLRDA